MVIAGYEEANNLIRAAFDSGWLDSNVPVLYDNFQQDPDADAPEPPFLRVQIQQALSRQVSMANDKRVRKDGQIVVEILVPAGEGEGRALELADDVETILETKNFGGAQMGTSRKVNVGSVKSAWKLNVVTDFYFDVFRT